MDQPLVSKNKEVKTVEKQCGFSEEDAQIAGESIKEAFKKDLGKSILKSFFMRTR